MSDAVHVREAVESDRQALERFHLRLYVEHRDQVVGETDLPLVEYRDYETVLREDLAALLTDRTAIILVAESEGAPVGYITGRVHTEARRVLPRRGVVEDWYVADEARGAGVGRALFTELENRFSGRGCDVVESATWAGNDGARKAHDALGFSEVRVMYRKRI